MQSRVNNARRRAGAPSGGARRRRPRRRGNPVVWAVLVVAALFLLGCIHMISVLGVGTPTFYNGVYLYGVNLSGLTYDEGRNLMQDMVQRWNDRTFTFTYLENSWQMKVSDIGADLDMDKWLSQAWNYGHTGNIFARRSQILALRKQPVYLTSEPTFDDAALDAFIEGIRQQIDVEPVDAVVVLTATQPELQTRSSNGYKLDVEAFRQQIIDLVKNGEDQQVATLNVETVKPTVDSGSASDGIVLVVEHSTDTSSSSATRLKNVALALSKFNGLAVYPGEQISFNKVVGKRTLANGFHEAPEYNGNKVQTGIGGGVCQASSTVYGALLKLNLQIDERDHHYMSVGYTPASFDATVSDSGQDLVFTNNTDHVFYFYTFVDSEEARVRVFSYPLDFRVELESVITQPDISYPGVRYEDDEEGKYVWYTDETVLASEGKKGCRSQCIRIFYDVNTGEELKREVVSSDYYFPQPDTYYRGVHKRGVDDPPAN